MKNDKLIKIIFNLKDNWHGYLTESLWGKFFSENTYTIDNIPFFTNDVSCGDVVKVIDDGKQYIFDSVIKRNGHSTYRVVIKKNAPDSNVLDLLNNLKSLGCHYEKGLNGMYTIDIEKDVDVKKVYEILESGEKINYWDFEEGNFQH